jgi:hypothetical protein
MSRVALLTSEDKVLYDPNSSETQDNTGERNTHCTKAWYMESSSVAATAERTVRGMRSTIPTVATLWCTMVDTGALVIGSYAGTDARRRCMVTARGGW